MTRDSSATPEPLNGPALADAYLEHLRAGGEETPEAYLARQGAGSEDALELLRIVLHFADEEPFTLQAGQALGSYRIETQLGSGGMGTVYLATVEEATAGLRVGARVALKVIHPHLLSRPGFFKRFLREADVGKRLHHENVVRVLDVDATEVDAWVTHYLAMEYVEGRTLRELLKASGPVSEGLLREVARQVASGLAAIHAAGIVHRDIKPENVLITHDHRVRIMDLGVARLVEQSAVLTREGQFAGTVLYAAPEQFGAGEVGPPADLYALGVMLYELASGENPFRRDETAGVVRAHLAEVPMPLADLEADLSAFCSGVVATLLAKDPAERFGSAAELCAALEGGERSSWWGEQEKTLRRLGGHLPQVPVRRETRLHGREGEIAVLRDAWQHAKDGQGSTILLHGEAGIGKSRVVDAFMGDLADVHAHVLYGSYPPSGGQGGITDALVEHFGSADLEEALRPFLTVTPSLVAPLASLLRHEPPPDGALSLAGDALHAVLVHLMRALAAEKPLLWVVDDLHFASADSRQVLLSLARAVEGHRGLLLLTSRPGLPEDELAHFSRLENYRSAGLGRLSPREVIELLRDAFRSDALAEKLGGKIAYQSDGVPFFVFEMIRGLKEGQFITELPDGSYVESKIVEEIEVPSAVRDLVEARLRDLTKEERAILDVAAVQGFEFDPDLLARIRHRTRIEILETLGDLERTNGAVSSTGRSFRFDHHQFQEVLYADLSEPLREEYHAALAEALEVREGARDTDPEALGGALCVDLAENFLKGGQGGRAVRFLRGAFEHLQACCANDRALTLGSLALDVPDLLVGKTRAETLLLMASLRDLLGERAEQCAALEEAVSSAVESRDLRLQARAYGLRGAYYLHVSRFDDAETEFRRAAAVSQESGDRESEGRYLGRLGNVFLTVGRYPEAQGQFERHLAIAREVGDRSGEALATANLGLVFSVLGRFGKAHEFVQRALVVFRATGDRRSEGKAMGALGMLLRALSRFEEAREHHERHLAIARAIGDRSAEGMARGNLGNVFMSLGRNAEALENYERHLGIARETGDRSGEGQGTGNVGRVHLAQGRYEEARECFERHLTIAREIAEPQSEARATGNLGGVYFHLGRFRKARECHEHALALFRDLGERVGQFTSTGHLGLVYFCLGSFEEAREYHERALSGFREIGYRAGEASSLGRLGVIEAEVSDEGDAVSLFEGALSIFRETGDLSGTASVLLSHGRLHDANGRKTEARTCLRDARSLGSELDAPRLLVLATCSLAAMPDGDAREAISVVESHGATLGANDMVDSNFLLWKATNDATHLTEAKRLLDLLVEHAPEEYRESMLKNVRLHREIMEAWAEHGGGEEPQETP